jgi:hypothetical protein
MQEKTSHTRLEGAEGSVDQADGGEEGGSDQTL